jgi:hypothetical protein
MAQSAVIKEFLVALGFKVDETAAKKFREGMSSATAAVLKLGAVIETTAIAVAVGVARWAGSLESLYFASQRTNASADQLQAFGLAARNFGASVDEALGSVEGLAAFLRNNPGGENFIANLLGSVGLSAKDANGHVMQGTALMAQLGKMFAIMREHNQTFRANQIAGQLGISDKTMLAMSTPGFAEEEARQEKRAKGWQKTAAAAHAFMVQLENMKMQFYQMMLGFEGPAMAALQRVMSSFSKFLSHHGKQAIRDLVIAFDWVIAGMGRLLDWLDAHGGEIQKRIDATLGQVAKTAAIVKPALEFVYDMFVKLDRISGGWSTNLLAVAAALKLVGASGIVTGIAALSVGLAKAAGASLGWATTAAEGGGIWAAAGAAWGVAAAAAIGYAIGSIINSFIPESLQHKIGDAEGGVANWVGSHWNQEKAKFWEFHADSVYAAKPNRDALDAKYSPHFTVTLNTTVHGAGDARQTAHFVASEAELAVRRSASALIREFATGVR